MEWYAPLTVLPAIGLIIMSTTNFIVALNNEIVEMEMSDTPNETVIILKLAQLRRLGLANASLYASSLCFLLAGLSSAVFNDADIQKYVMIAGVSLTAIALTLLFIHSMKAVSIRHKRLKLK